MVTGLGIDLVENERIERSLLRFGGGFLTKILHESEIAAMPSGEPAAPPLARYVAARFAAKEAAVKALGTGFAQGVSPRDVRVSSLPSGQPVLSLHGKARERADSLGVVNILLSLTHDKKTSAAVVVLESA